MPPLPEPGAKPKPDLEPEPELAVSKDIGWRYAVLQQAGWDEPEARTIAFRTDIDLHRACDLLTNGCEQTLALEILL